MTQTDAELIAAEDANAFRVLYDRHAERSTASTSGGPATGRQRST